MERQRVRKEIRIINWKIEDNISMLKHLRDDESRDDPIAVKSRVLGIYCALKDTIDDKNDTDDR